MIDNLYEKKNWNVMIEKNSVLELCTRLIRTYVPSKCNFSAASKPMKKTKYRVQINKPINTICF